MVTVSFETCEACEHIRRFHATQEKEAIICGHSECTEPRTIFGNLGINQFGYIQKPDWCPLKNKQNEKA